MDERTRKKISEEMLDAVWDETDIEVDEPVTPEEFLELKMEFFDRYTPEVQEEYPGGACELAMDLARVCLLYGEEVITGSFPGEVRQPLDRNRRYLKNMKLSGVTFNNAQENIKRFGRKDIDSFAVVREPDNPNDRNAIRVEAEGHFLGYVPRAHAKELAPLMDSGRRFVAYFLCLNNHPSHDTVGLTVCIDGVPVRDAA